MFSFTPDDPFYGWNRLLGYRFLIFIVLIYTVVVYCDYCSVCNFRHYN